MKIRNASHLTYGQTPWDLLTREELLLMVCRYHATMTSLASCLRMARAIDSSNGDPDPNSLYFGPGGSGGIALAQADYMERIDGEDKATEDGDLARDNVYRMFFRSACDVLFPDITTGRQIGWYLCEKCGTMIGNGNKVDPPKRFCACDAVWRPFRMSDIRPDLDVDTDVEVVDKG